MKIYTGTGSILNEPGGSVLDERIHEIGDLIYHTITGSRAKHLEILALMDIGIEAYEILGKIQQSGI